jgi:hypothetical protein
MKTLSLLHCRYAIFQQIISNDKCNKIDALPQCRIYALLNFRLHRCAKLWCVVVEVHLSRRPRGAPKTSRSSWSLLSSRSLLKSKIISLFRRFIIILHFLQDYSLVNAIFKIRSIFNTAFLPNIMYT